jgi:type IX secretion system PorP/SprF family membrane protein
MYYYLRFGLRAGIANYSPNLDYYHLYPDQIPDPEFLSNVNHQFMTAFGFGAVIFDDNLYVSLSVPQVINNTFKVNREGYSSLQEFKTAYLSGGYMFKLPMSLLLRPNLLVVGTVGKPVYFDVAGVVYLPSNLQFGVNIRSNGSSCFSGQYTFSNGLRIGFAADYAFFQDIRKFQYGTYEVMVGYDFNVYRKKNARPNYF